VYVERFAGIMVAALSHKETIYLMHSSKEFLCTFFQVLGSLYPTVP